MVEVKSQFARKRKATGTEQVKAGRVAQLPDAFSDPKIVELQKKLGELTVTYSQLDVTYGQKNPKVIEIKQQIAAIEQQAHVF